MKKVSLLAGVAALATLPFVAPALSATCVTGSVATYTTANFSCTLGDLSFSNFTVTTLVSNGGSVVLGNFTPFSQVINGVLETGLTLNYDANAPAGHVPAATADVSWLFTVTGLNGTLITDVYASLTGTTTLDGTARLGETFSNGATLSLLTPGSTTVNFAPVGSLSLSKDQADHANTGSSETSLLTNAFSTTAIPGPIVGAGLPGLIAACAGLIGLARRRRRIIA